MTFANGDHGPGLCECCSPPVLMDLGVGDVHRDSAGGHYEPIDAPTLEALKRSLDDGDGEAASPAPGTEAGVPDKRKITLPFVSRSQRSWMHIHHPEMAKRWERHTPKGTKLPRHVNSADRAGGEAAIVVIDNGNGCVLSVSRHAALTDLGFPGGMVEPGETPSQAAIREVWEETGVEVRRVTPLFSGPASDDPTRTVHVFAAHPDDTDILSAPGATPEPGTRVCWVLPSELLGPSNTFAAFARRHFDQLFGHLRKVSMTDKKKIPYQVVVGTTETGLMVVASGEVEEGATIMADLDAAKRKGLSGDQFADPAERKYPINDANHTRNAAARLEQQKSSMSPAKYKAIRGRIAAAAKRFGIKSSYNAPSKKASANGGRQSISVHADIAPGGRVHVVHHMSDKEGREWTAYPIVTSGTEDVGHYRLLADEGQRPKKLVWIQLAEVGSFRGHPAGDFALTPAVFSEIVQNFDRDGIPVPIDYEHASEQDPTAGNIPVRGAPAQGWIHKLESRGTMGLWGLVEWLPHSADQIRSGQYRYISPAIRFGAKDRETGHNIGAKLTSAGLTNQPFLKGMQVLAAKDASVPMQTLASGVAGVADNDADGDDDGHGSGGRTLDESDAGDAKMGAFAAYRAARMAAFSNFGAFAAKPAEYMPQLKAAFGLHDLATCKEVMAQFCRLRDRLIQNATATVGDKDSGSDGVNLNDYIKPLRDIAAKDNIAATVDHVLDVVHHMICAAMERHELEMHMDQLAEDDEREAAETGLMQDLAKDAALAAAFGDTTPKPPQGTTKAGDTAMTDIKLDDHQKALAAKDTEIEGLKLQITTKDGKITEMTAQLTEFQGREQARLLKDLDVEADAIIANPENHLAPEKKATVLKLLKDSPDATRETWKPATVAVGDKLPPKYVALRQNLPPTGRPSAAAPQAGESDKIPDVIVMTDGTSLESRILTESIDETTTRLLTEKKLPYEEAAQEAWDLHNTADRYTKRGAVSAH